MASEKPTDQGEARPDEDQRRPRRPVEGNGPTPKPKAQRPAEGKDSPVPNRQPKPPLAKAKGRPQGEPSPQAAKAGQPRPQGQPSPEGSPRPKSAPTSNRPARPKPGTKPAAKPKSKAAPGSQPGNPGAKPKSAPAKRPAQAGQPPSSPAQQKKRPPQSKEAPRKKKRPAPGQDVRVAKGAPRPKAEVPDTSGTEMALDKISKFARFFFRAGKKKKKPAQPDKPVDLKTGLKGLFQLGAGKKKKKKRKGGGKQTVSEKDMIKLLQQGAKNARRDSWVDEAANAGEFAITLSGPLAESQKERRGSFRVVVRGLSARVGGLGALKARDISATGIGLVFQGPRQKAGTQLTLSLTYGQKVVAQKIPATVRRHEGGILGLAFDTLDRIQEDAVCALVLRGQKEQASRRSGQ